MAKTYYVDVTMTVQQGFNTGVQRVVRAIVSHGQELARQRGAALVPVVAWGGRFHAVRPDRQDALFRQRGAAGGSGVYAPSPRWRRLARQAVAMFPRHIYTGLLDREAERVTRRAGEALCDPAQVAFGPDDRLLLIDSLAARSPAVRAARQAQADGVATVPLVYDLIPITHPRYVSDDARRNFEESLFAVLPRSAGVMAISRFVRSETLDLLRQQRLSKPVESFYLGHDFGDAGRDERGQAPAVGGTVAAPLFLMVGSIDPRKGHSYVLDAFERLWARDVAADLFIVGKTLGDTDAFAARCAAHPELGRRLRLGHDVSDAELRAAMQAAHGAVIASTVEGFGLPLVECLSVGLPVLASDIPVFREIAGDHAQFFDLTDPASLAAQVERLIADPARYRALAASFAWIGWQASVEQFLDGVDRITDGGDKARSSVGTDRVDRG